MRKLSTHLVGLRRPQGPVCLGWDFFLGPRLAGPNLRGGNFIPGLGGACLRGGLGANGPEAGGRAGGVGAARGPCVAGG